MDHSKTPEQQSCFLCTQIIKFLLPCLWWGLPDLSTLMPTLICPLLVTEELA